MKVVIKCLYILIILLTADSALAVSFSGTLSLPADYSPTSDGVVRISAVRTDQPFSRSVDVTVAAGATMGAALPFVIDDIDLNADDLWRLEYVCMESQSLDFCEDFLVKAYHADNIAGPDNTVYQLAAATLIPADRDKTGISLTLLPGITVTGQLGLPPGVAAGPSITYNLIAVSSALPPDQLTMSSRTIDPAETSGSFKFKLPDDDATTWTLMYDCSPTLAPDCMDYLRNGYFNSAETDNTTDDDVAAEPIHVVTTPGNINMRLLRGLTVEGTLNMATAIPDPGASVLLRVENADDPTDVYTQTYTVNAGTTEIAYLVRVPTSDTIDWFVGYNCHSSVTPIGCGPYVSPGFYSASTTTLDQAESELLAGGRPLESIDMTMLAGSTISGRIVLSGSVALEGGLTVLITAENTLDTNNVYVHQVTIPGGYSEVDFAFSVDPDSSKSWLLGYRCLQTTTPDCDLYTSSGFYDDASGATVVSIEAATALIGGFNHSMKDMSIELVKVPDDTICFPVATGSKVIVICL